MRARFADHAVIITGASDGIGAEIARQLADEHAWLVLAARRAHELDLVAQECIARGARAIVVPTDVTDPVQCANLVARGIEAYGKVDVLVNNAGLRAHFRFADVTDLSVFERVMRVNLLGSVYCTHAALPALLASRGRLAAVSSIAGKTGVPYRTAYAAGKHAVQGFFDSLRMELHGTGVTVTLVCPSYVHTGPSVHALGPTGVPLDSAALVRRGAMPVKECARQAIEAIRRRKREVVMVPVPRLVQALRALAPKLVDRIVARASERGRLLTRI